VGAWYCTREDVKSALDVKETARNNAQVDRIVEAASRTVEGYLHRKFYPQLATRYFDWPNRAHGSSYRIWLDADEVISVTTLTAAGTAISAADYFLEPANSGPPYTHLELDRGSSASFDSGDTHQRAIAMTGLFGHSAETEAVGELTATLEADVDDDATLSWTTARVGVGDILLVDDERLVISDRSMVDSTQNLQSALTASMADDVVAVTTGSGFGVDEVILLDSERMLIVDIAGNNLTVKRAWDGTTLAAHTGSDIYALTGITVKRAQFGTTLAEHTTGDTVYRHVVPGLVKDLTVAEAVNQLLQETSGYARQVGAGDHIQELFGRGLQKIRDDATRRYGRKRFGRAV